MEESIETLIQVSSKTTQDPDGFSVFWRQVLGRSSWQDGFRKEVYHNVISGTDFKADVEAAHDPELVCMHCDETESQGSDVARSPPPGVRRKSFADLPRSLVGETTCRMRSEHSKRRSLSQADTLSCTQPLVLISLRCEAVGRGNLSSF